MKGRMDQRSSLLSTSKMFLPQHIHVSSVPCYYVHVCFVQVTTCGAPDALTRVGACTFSTVITPSWITEQISGRKVRTPRRAGSAKQFSKLSLGQNKHGRNKPVPSVPSVLSIHPSIRKGKNKAWTYTCNTLFRNGGRNVQGDVLNGGTKRLCTIAHNGCLFVCWQAQACEWPGCRPKGPGLPGVRHHHRGQAAGRPQHGPCRLCSGMCMPLMYFV